MSCLPMCHPLSFGWASSSHFLGERNPIPGNRDPPKKTEGWRGDFGRVAGKLRESGGETVGISGIERHDMVWATGEAEGIAERKLRGNPEGIAEGKP